MVRALALILLAVLLVGLVPQAAVGAGGPPIQRFFAQPGGWGAERFTSPGDRIRVDYGILGTSEVVGDVIHLYDGNGNFLRGTMSIFIGGNKVDVTIKDGPGISTDDVADGDRINPETAVIFLCNAACNPSREFIVVVSGSGDNITQWGYGVSSNGWGAKISNTSGTRAATVSTRMFDGLVASALVGPVGEGVSIARDARFTADVQHNFAGGFVKFGAQPTQMFVDTPTGTVQCSCGIGVRGAGPYTFHYDDTDVRGDEGYVSYVDFVFP